ncbi:bacteriohemerythrin [Paraburkholderia atlantica]|uniref:bacteriohemerythrin n=1 Tax=Paraburkholderia atlantica TaxID=2654982 RepID=UPI00160EFFB2|nr:hemerythrin domain-containing protein [Paraburkholderia atlantica]MBB5421518.1 hemerythrin-like metal-binding protein [Paraburkholderia atlantica]
MMNTRQTPAHHEHRHAPRQARHVEKLEWNDAMLMGHGPMDDSHEEFVAVVNALRNSTVETALACLAAMESHLVSHFELEHSWMDKTAFPEAYSKCHRDQHDEVLEAVQRVRQMAIVGAVGLSTVHRLAQSLIDWFPGHADYMDSSLSAWINDKLHGGQAVVIRRNMAHEDRVPGESEAIAA